MVINCRMMLALADVLVCWAGDADCCGGAAGCAGAGDAVAAVGAAGAMAPALILPKSIGSSSVIGPQLGICGLVGVGTRGGLGPGNPVRGLGSLGVAILCPCVVRDGVVVPILCPVGCEVPMPAIVAILPQSGGVTGAAGRP